MAFQRRRKAEQKHYPAGRRGGRAYGTDAPESNRGIRGRVLNGRRKVLYGSGFDVVTSSAADTNMRKTKLLKKAERMTDIEGFDQWDRDNIRKAFRDALETYHKRPGKDTLDAIWLACRWANHADPGMYVAMRGALEIYDISLRAEYKKNMKGKNTDEHDI